MSILKAMVKPDIMRPILYISEISDLRFAVFDLLLKLTIPKSNQLYGTCNLKYINDICSHF